MVLNAAVQMLREAEELKLKILKFKSGTSMLQERSLWTTQQQLQKVYQKVLVLDLDYALDKKVEQDLWNICFKQQIEALQAISKDRKNPIRSDGQAMLSWVLQAAAGFYLCLLHQICTTFKLDLPFRRRASLLGWVEGWGASGGEHEGEGRVSVPPPAAARYICQHCLVHLGDLARYRQQLRVAHTFYRHALLVSAHSGQPYNQLALVAWRRGGQLSALYWHVRSLLVRAPFPPAPANLARTLAAAARRTRDSEKELPVIPGLIYTAPESSPPVPTRLDSHNYVDELIRALHLIHTLEDLDTATQLVQVLNSSLTPLVATDSFESMTLVKMACVIIWLVHSSTEELSLSECEVTGCEERGAALAVSLAAGSLLALLLPVYTRPPTDLAALKVWMSWVRSHPQVLSRPAFLTRPQLWPALAHAFNALAELTKGFDGHIYATLPLPEDEELHGFLPLEQAFTGLKFTNYASWDTYGDRIPDHHHGQTDGDETQFNDQQDQILNNIRSPSDMTEQSLSSEPELEHKLRAHRLVRLGRELADHLQGHGQDHLTVTVEEGMYRFSASSLGSQQLSLALAELTVPPSAPTPPPAHPPPPVVISEADFREKVREKRVGILKPQGSLERAREERAQATNTQEELEVEESEDSSDKTDESRKEIRKPRMNVAMAAIMRKQEETNKQVKFVTPATTPDSVIDTVEISQLTQEKPKIIQPKAIKSLANIPIGRKTGGILSLKDKSAGYPHLVNAEPEPVKVKPEKEEKKNDSIKSNSLNQQINYNTFKPRQELHPSSPNWPSNIPNAYSNNPRINFQPKTYGIQNVGISFNPTYQQANAIGVNNQGIRLPVVNPKEIDVRSAALQKQNSRQELFHEGPKYNNYQMSEDKKNFLNDLPPRFANQYRYWQHNMQNDNKFSSNQDNKFRDDNFKNTNSFAGNNFGSTMQQPNNRSWMMNQPISQDNYAPQQQPQSWWKPDPMQTNYTNFTTPSMNVQQNFYSPHLQSNPYQNLSTYNQQMGPTKPDNSNSIPPNYMQSTIVQPQAQNLQNLVSPSNFNSSLNSFGTYGQTVGYDSTMYPQFSNKLVYSPQMKMGDKTLGQFSQGKDVEMAPGLGYGGSMLGDLHQRNPMTFNDMLNTDINTMKNIDQHGISESVMNDGQGSTYSLFSGAQELNAWGATQRPPPQSLWSGPGPSLLERLLEQQKQIKQPPNEPQ